VVYVVLTWPWLRKKKTAHREARVTRYVLAPHPVQKFASVGSAAPHAVQCCQDYTVRQRSAITILYGPLVLRFRQHVSGLDLIIAR